MVVNKKIILALSLSAVFLIIFSGLISILTPEFYYRESFNWQVQSIGQDLINIFLAAPLLLIVSLFIKQKINISFWMWAGINLYLVYTYSIYAFSVHYNSLFIAYSLILGLSFYSVLYFVYLGSKITVTNSSTYLKITGIYFITISILFYILWLSEIIPSVIDNITPQSLSETGLTTNPVHVIDLSVFLPGLFITGIFLLKKNKIGMVLAAPLLTFTILMNITIAMLVIIMKYKGLSGDITISFIMFALALFSLILLIKSAHRNL